MADIIGTYYGGMEGQYRMSSTRKARLLYLLDRAVAELSSGRASLLDIGMGSGEIAEYCRERYGRRLYLEGADVTSSVVEQNRRLYDRTHVVNVDAPHWTASFDRKFDIIVASELLEHLFRPDLFLACLHEIMKPGAAVIITTPNLLLWTKRVKFLFGIHEWSDRGVYEWGHIHLFSWRFFRRTLSRSGFRIVDSYHLMHPNALNPFHRVFPGLFAFQFIVLLRRT